MFKCLILILKHCRFKLHLRPKALMSTHIKDEDVPDLPPNKTAVDVLSDFLVYLYNCAKVFIQETHANGVELWRSVAQTIQFVFSHPNGWAGVQQNQMRSAAVLGGIIPNTEEGRSRIEFVTEGEASLHFCIANGLASEAMKVCLAVCAFLVACNIDRNIRVVEAL
jgi:hypothetical protein